MAGLAAIGLIRLSRRERGDEVFKPAVMRRNAMRGNENEDVASRGGAAIVQGAAEGEVRFLDMDDAAPFARGDVERRVRRPGIDQDEFDRAPRLQRLRLRRRERLPQPFLLIERTVDDGNRGGRHERRTSGTKCGALKSQKTRAPSTRRG